MNLRSVQSTLLPASTYYDVFFFLQDFLTVNSFHNLLPYAAPRHLGVRDSMTAARTCQYIAHDQVSRLVTQEPSMDPINRKRPRHKWEREDREVLCLLYRFYNNSAKDLTAIFNYLFKDRLEREKFKNGLASTTLATQWHDMRIGSNGNDLWREKTLTRP